VGIFVHQEEKFLISASEAFAQISAKSLIEERLSLHLFEHQLRRKVRVLAAFLKVPGSPMGQK
jgi:hypothetical protein